MSKFREFEAKVHALKKDIEGCHLGLIKITYPFLQHLRALNVTKQHHGGETNETSISVTRDLIKTRITLHIDTLTSFRSTLINLETPSDDEHPLDSITTKAMLYRLNEALDAYRHEIVIVQDAIQL